MIVSDILGIVGIIVGILAIAQAIYYYDKAKDAQHAADMALLELKEQTNHIRTFSHTLLSRALKTISGIAENSGRGPADKIDMQQIMQSLNEIKDAQSSPKSVDQKQPLVPSSNQIADHGLPNLADPLTKDTLQSEAVSAIGQIFIYAGLANIYAQYLLPPQSELETKLLTDPQLKSNIEVVNHSFATCNNAYAWLKQLKEQNAALLGDHKLLPYVLQHEQMFNYQLRNAAQACEFWESFKKGA